MKRTPQPALTLLLAALFSTTTPIEAIKPHYLKLFLQKINPAPSAQSSEMTEKEETRLRDKIAQIQRLERFVHMLTIGRDSEKDHRISRL